MAYRSCEVVVNMGDCLHPVDSYSVVAQAIVPAERIDSRASKDRLA